MSEETYFVLVNKSNRKEQLSITRFCYGLILRKAFENGWEPAGTIEPHDWRSIDYNDSLLGQLADMGDWEFPGSHGPGHHFTFDPDKKWSGAYDTGQGQEVTAEDAMALADALQRTLNPKAVYDSYFEEVLKTPEIFLVESEQRKSLDHWGEEEGWAEKYRVEEARRALEKEEILMKEIVKVIAFCRRGAFLVATGYH